MLGKGAQAHPFIHTYTRHSTRDNVAGWAPPRPRPCSLATYHQSTCANMLIDMFLLLLLLLLLLLRESSRGYGPQPAWGIWDSPWPTGQALRCVCVCICMVRRAAVGRGSFACLDTCAVLCCCRDMSDSSPTSTIERSNDLFIP